ncbi:MAG: chromosomal replication initiator protein DnaA [Patescibacteria group bacterium]|nr:MAG: chromosomal replication initiator protein DnaA [Patescibacteria group bacterium]
MREKELWKNTLSCLETELSKATISTFFAGTELASLEKSRAKILCPSRLSAGHLKSRYGGVIAATLNTLSGQKCSLSFEVKKIAPSKPQELGPIFRTSEQHMLVASYTLENFVVGLSNQLAVGVAQAVVEEPGTLHNPFFLHSGVGLGKTHLIHAIGNLIKQQRPDAQILYSPAEQFTNELIRSIQNRRSAVSFRRKFRSVDVLLIDDIQFLAGREATQEEFFNTFNELYLSGKQIILTSDRHPHEIPRLEQRLISRFSGGIVADIQEPDLDMKIEILRRKSKEKGASIQEEVFLALAEQVSGSIRKLEGLLNQLITIAAAQNVPPSADLVEDIVRSAPPSSVFVSPDKVIQTVCQRFSVKPEDIRSPRRAKEIVRPRQITAYLLRSMGSLSLQKIGDLLGGRDHSTILHGIKKIEGEVEENPTLRNQINTLNVEIFGRNL